MTDRWDGQQADLPATIDAARAEFAGRPRRSTHPGGILLAAEIVRNVVRKAADLLSRQPMR